MAVNGVLQITDAEITGVTKIVYAGFRNKLFPMSTPLLANVKKGSRGGSRNLRWGGKGVNFDAVVGRPVGMSASPSGYFPPSHAVTEVQGTLDIERLYVQRQIDGLAINGTLSKDAAYISLAKKILEEAKDAATLGMQEILHGDGKAIKAVISSVTDDDTIVISAPYGISGAGQGGLLLDAGSYVAVLDATNSWAVLGRSALSSLTHSGDSATAELATAISGMAQGDVLVAATASDTSYNNYPNGLVNITNRGGSYAQLHNISASTYNRWNAVRMVAGTDTPDATIPTESDIWDLITKVAGQSGKDAKLRPGEFLLLTTPGLEKKFAESYLGQRRFTPEGLMNIKGGFKAVNICGLPMISDVWCPAGTVYLVHLPSLVWVDAKDWGQVEFNGAGAWRWVNGQDAFEINFGAYIQFGSLQRNAHGSITGYTDTARYSFVM